MQRPATWKILTIGAALTGLSLAGAGTAFADSGQPMSVAAVPGGFSTDWPFDDLLDDVDDLAQFPHGIPQYVGGFDDDWRDDWYGDDDWGDD
jgi:hypothetical protein